MYVEDGAVLVRDAIFAASGAYRDVAATAGAAPVIDHRAWPGIPAAR